MEKTLKSILDIGKKMHDALSADDLDAFYTLVDQREVLIDQLRAPEKNYALPAEASQALEKQFNTIINALNKKEHHMMEQLQQLDRMKKANHSYKGPQKRRELINRTLLG